MARVMIAEDTDAIRLLLEDILSIVKHELVYQAKDGAEAVEKYASIKPDILLMDLSMPKKDGITALKEIKKTYPDAKIIMLSAIGSFMASECLEAGAIAFFPKPFDFDKVLKILKEV